MLIRRRSDPRSKAVLGLKVQPEWGAGRSPAGSPGQTWLTCGAARQHSAHISLPSQPQCWENLPSEASSAATQGWPRSIPQRLWLCAVPCPHPCPQAGLPFPAVEGAHSWQPSSSAGTAACTSFISTSISSSFSAALGREQKVLGTV